MTLAGKAGTALLVAGVLAGLAAYSSWLTLSTRVEVRNTGSSPLRDVVVLAGGEFPVGTIGPGRLACTDVQPQRDDSAKVATARPQGGRRTCASGAYVTGLMGGRHAFLMDAAGRCDARANLDDSRFRLPCALVEAGDRLGWRSAGTQ